MTCHCGVNDLPRFSPNGNQAQAFAIQSSAMTSICCFMLDESQLPLRGAIQVVGCTGRIATNHEGLLGVLSSICTPKPSGAAIFRLLVWVHSEPPTPASFPYFRGLQHLVFARFGCSNLFVFDLLTRSIQAAITAELAHDRSFWQERLLPIAVGVFGAGIGVLPLHAACLSFNGRGVLIAGVSGTGKSNLSLAMAQIGADFISDDWTYIADNDGDLCAHGMFAPIKLLPDAVRYFPELRQYDVRVSLNGELAYELSPGDTLQLRVEGRCKPACFVFYERVPTGGPELIRVSGEQASKYIQASIEPLPLQLSRLSEQREQIASRIAELPCWHFRHSGNPHLAARALHEFLAPQQIRIHT